MERTDTKRANLTKRAIEVLEIPADGRTQLYDEQVRGLGVQCVASGKKTFFWFRKVRGYPTWRVIGDWPDLTVEKARAAATEFNSLRADWKATMYAGPNPFERASVEPTFDALVEAYIVQHLRQHAKRPDAAEAHLRWLVKFYLPAWRTRKLTEITSEDVAEFHRRAGEKHGHRTANRIVKQLRTLFRFAIVAKLWRGEVPTMGIKFFHEPKRTRFLQPDELPRLWAALRSAPNPDLRDYVNLALWTGARKMDVLSMRWQDVSLQDNRWTIPDPKNRTPYIVPLTPESVLILKARLQNRVEDSPWVFPSCGRTGHLVDVKGRWKELLQAAGLYNPNDPELKITQHDLRRTHASWMAGLGTSLPIIAKALGHTSTAATQIYSRLHLDPVREAMEGANRAIGAAMRKKPKLLKPAPRRVARA